MNNPRHEAVAEPPLVDARALRLMLVYVAAECRRMGALDAARLADEAAELVPDHPAPFGDGRKH